MVLATVGRNYSQIPYLYLVSCVCVCVCVCVRARVWGSMVSMMYMYFKCRKNVFQSVFTQWAGRPAFEQSYFIITGFSK